MSNAADIDTGAEHDPAIRALRLLVHGAVASIDDPEYPGVSIVDLGLLESLDIETDADGRTHARIGLIPTFSGCPALAVIAAEVDRAVADLDQVDDAEVRWLTSPAWHADRVSHEARSQLAKKFTVAVQIGQRAPVCPVCGSHTVEQSMFGPSRCRSVHTCAGCGETVEVMRG
jgi:ring-1,2-phenylacetyl-CoA epoxidase subunit PaaD